MRRQTFPLADVRLAPPLHHTGDTSFTTRIACTVLRKKPASAITAIGQGVLFCRPRRARCVLSQGSALTALTNEV
ncbi:hypothetical protein XFF7766_490017 [Xanthomonas citri pv. fuscans]|nr:hypothetical protein XFF7766_490017 [Xanthomonas citri pv. fuscans]